MQNEELRPLGPGEMLDRAITLYVRRFGPIVAVLAVVAVPVTILEAILTPYSAHAFTDLFRVFSTIGDPSASRQAADTITRMNRGNVAAFGVVAVAGVARLLMWCALVNVIATAYEGSRTSLGAAYRFALGRWFPQVVVALAFVIAGTIVAVPLFILYIVVIIAIVGLIAAHLTVVAIVAGAVGLLVVFGLAVIVEPIVFMTYELASVAVITETANPIEAIATAMRRALARGMKRRTLVAGIVVFLVSQLGLVPILSLAILLSALAHVDALYFAVIGTGSVLLDGIVASFVVVFAFDARVRREGYGLVAAAAPGAP